jgi:hypothetical protein
MGYYILFELNKQIVRKEMQSVILQKSEKLITLTIADAAHDPDFQRIHKKEFRYKGSMYDIVCEIKSGSKTVFICVHDAKESKLFAGLKRVNQNKHHFALWDHLNLVFFSEHSIDLNPSFSGSLIFPRINITLKSSTLQTWSPPPEFS